MKSFPHLSQKEFIFSSFYSFSYSNIFWGAPTTLSCVIAPRLPSPSRHFTPAPFKAMCPMLGTSLGFRKYLVNRALVLLFLLSSWLCSWEWFLMSQEKALGKARPEDSPAQVSQWLSFSKHGSTYLHIWGGLSPPSVI